MGNITSYVRNREFLTCLSWFYRIDLKRLDLNLGLTSEFSEFFDKIPVIILLMCSFVCLGFLKRLSMP